MRRRLNNLLPGKELQLRRSKLARCLLGLSFMIIATPALASEGGTSVYLLGSTGPGAAELPPVEGVFYDNTFYLYSADEATNLNLVLGGNVAAGVDISAPIDVNTMLWVPSTNFAGGTLALALTLPVGGPSINAEAILTGPAGGQVGVRRDDSVFTLGDPVVSAMIGWKTGNLHVQASTFVNLPIGDYREGALANISFNRWAGDFSLAASYIDPKTGWDLSTKAGFTFNGTNEFTDYNTGTEFHLEGAVEKKFSPKFSAGVVGYYFDQVSGDSGSGAVLGPFEGRVAALGGTAKVTFLVGKMPATLRLKVFKEFDAQNRPEGTVGFLSFTIPLKVNMPAGATGHAGH